MLGVQANGPVRVFHCLAVPAQLDVGYLSLNVELGVLWINLNGLAEIADRFLLPPLASQGYLQVQVSRIAGLEGDDPAEVTGRRFKSLLVQMGGARTQQGYSVARPVEKFRGQPLAGTALPLRVPWKSSACVVRPPSVP